MNKEIKSIEFMSVERKIIYAKILALMLSMNLTEEKTVAYYRLLAQIRVDVDSRMLLLDYIMNPTDELEILCGGVIEGLVDQEYNIIRFSLIKDLIILKRAGQTSDDEYSLFNEVRELLNVPEEYISYFTDEYENDQVVFTKDYDETLLKKLAKEQIALTTSLGIPTSYLYYRGYLNPIIENRRRNNGFLLNLQKLGVIRKKNKKISTTDLITALSLGIITYGLTKYQLNKNNSNEKQLKEMVLTKAQRLHERATAYLIKDINFLKENHQLIDDNQELLEETLQPTVMLLEGALKILKKCKPVLL